MPARVDFQNVVFDFAFVPLPLYLRYHCLRFSHIERKWNERESFFNFSFDLFAFASSFARCK